MVRGMWFILIAVALWFAFGDPSKTVANAFYEDDAAPWETVDAFYYPNRYDLSVSQSVTGLDDVDDCRRQVRQMAYAANDSMITRGDYECAVGRLKKDFAGLAVYRITVR